ncbi:hypothetical protein N9385_00640 [Candidatus Nitrosopelagicus sp.]|nr:hypothetical protein [Candidatus Nitrosopelagicus sp.]
MVIHKKPENNKQTTGGIDNKILRILVHLKNKGKSGDSRRQTAFILPKGANDNQMKDFFDKTSTLGWTKSKVVTAGKQQTTVYNITPEGKKALKEIQDLVSKSTYISKLDAFDQVFETKTQKLL